MNGDDSFEARLKRQPWRRVPAAWRNEILAAARPLQPTRPSLFATLFWPHPKAWAALAAVWLLVLGLNFTNRDASAVVSAREVVKPSEQVRELLRQQEQMLAELNGPAELSQTVPAIPLPPQPRSQRRDEFLYA